MKTWHKRGLAWLMTAAMLAGSIPVSGFAAEDELVSEGILKESVSEASAPEDAVLDENVFFGGNSESGFGEKVFSGEEDLLLEDLIEEEILPSESVPEVSEGAEVSGTGDAETEAETEVWAEEELLFEESAEENTTELAAEEDIGEAGCRYDLPGCGPQLPGWWWSIDKNIRYWQEDGTEGWTEITDLKVEVKEESARADAVTAEPYDDGTGWTVHMNDYGHAVVTMEYLLADDEGTAEYTCDVWVVGNVYNISVDSDTSTDQLLPGSSLNLNAQVWQDCYDEEHGHYPGNVDDVTVEWTCTEGEDAVSIKYGDDDRTVKITANAGTGGRNVKMEARAYVPNPEADGGREEVAGTEFGIWISDAYYKIEPISVDPLAVGDSTGIDPVLKLYEVSEKPSGEQVDNSIVRYRWEWDERAVRITDRTGTELRQEESTNKYTYGEPAFVLTKLKNWNTDVTLIAELNEVGENEKENWQEVTRRGWRLEEYEYNVWFENLRGGDDTWVFNDEELTLAINTERLAGKSYEVQWQVGFWDETLNNGNGDINTGESAAYFKDNHDGSITLSGEDLPQDGANVRAVICAGGEEVFRADTYVHRKESVCVYQYPCLEPGENEILIHDGLEIPGDLGCYVENSTYPWGEDLSVEIMNAWINKQECWSETENDWVSTDQIVASLNKEDGGWKLTGENYGRVFVTLEHQSLSQEEAKKSFELEIYVNGDSYSLSRYYPNDTDCMLVNTVMDIVTSLYHDWRYGDDWNGEEIKDYYLELMTDDVTGELCYDQNLVTAEIENGCTLRIEAKGETGDTSIPVRIMVREQDENGNPIADENDAPRYFGVGVRNFHVNVTREYHYILPLELLDENDERINVKLGGTLAMSDYGLAVYRNREGWGKPEKEPEDTVRFRLEYDKNAWDVQKGTEEEALPVLVRKQPWGTGVTVVAEKYDAEAETENEEEKWREVAGRDYWFDELDMNLEYDWLYSDEGRDGRIFVGTPQEITLDTKKLDAVIEDGDYTVKWTVDENVSCEVSGEKNEKLILCGSSEHRDERVEVYAAVYQNGQEMAGCSMEFCIVEEDAWYNLPDPEYWMLKGWDVNFSKETDCWIQNVKHPYGDDLSMVITDVKLTVDEGAPRCIELREWEDGNGWNIYVHNQGHASVTVTYDLEDGTTGVYEFEICVGGELYDMELISSTGTDQVLPGGSLYLAANVWGYGYNEERGHYDADITGLTVEWKCEEDAPVRLTDHKDGTALVQAEESEEDIDIRIEAVAYLPDENGDKWEIARRDFWIHIRNGYYQLAGVSKDENKNFVPLTLSSRMGIGAEQTVEPVLWYFDSSENTESRIMDGVRYRWEWDPNAVCITDGEDRMLNQQEEDGSDSIGTAPFVLERTGDWGTRLRLVAEIPDENGEYQEMASCDWWLDELNYNVWFEDPRGGGDYTWMFEDEEYTLHLNTDNLQGLDAAVEWSVGYFVENGSFISIPASDSTGTVNYEIDGEQGTITFYGSSLSAMEGLRNSSLVIAVDVYSDSETSDDAKEREEVRMDIISEEESLEDDEYYEIVLSSHQYYQDGKISYWLKNAANPQGRDYTLRIKKITAENCDENGAPVSDAEDMVFSCDRNEETNSWDLQACREGYGRITYELTDPDGELEDFSVVRIRRVCSEKYILRVNTDSETNILLPEAGLQLQPVLYKCEYDPDMDEIVYSKVEENNFELEYRDYDDNLITVDENGSVTAEDRENGQTSIHAAATVFETNENGEAIPCGRADGWIGIDVASEYKVFRTDSFTAVQGAAISIDDVSLSLISYTQEYPEGTELSDRVEFFFGPAQDTGITFTEDKKTAYIDSEIVNPENPEHIIEMELAAVYTDDYGNREVYNGWWTLTVQFVCPGHSPKDGSEKTIRAATCSQKGIKEYLCRICGEIYREETPVIADAHKYSVTTETGAACTADGSRTYTCEYCHHSYNVKNGNALGHSWNGGSVTKAATCTAAGVKTYTCTRPGCSATKKETIPAAGHKWGGWTATAQATVFAAEQQKRTCSVCGKTETRALGSRLTPAIRLNATNVLLKVGQSTTKLAVSGLANGDYVVSWSSGNTSIVGVDVKTGKLTAQKKTGTAKVTVKLASGKTADITVKVQKGSVKTTKITGLASKATLNKGKTLTLKPVLEPITSLEKVSYSTSNKKVATVNSKGVITAKAAGTAKITVKSGSKKFVVIVTVPRTATTAIRNVPSALSLKKKKSYTLKPKLNPSNSDEKITYTSSNKKVATVSSKGKITAKGAGTAVITVKSGKISFRCTVTVK